MCLFTICIFFSLKCLLDFFAKIFYVFICVLPERAGGVSLGPYFFYMELDHDSDMSWGQLMWDEQGIQDILIRETFLSNQSTEISYINFISLLELLQEWSGFLFSWIWS